MIKFYEEELRKLNELLSHHVSMNILGETMKSPRKSSSGNIISTLIGKPAPKERKSSIANSNSTKMKDLAIDLSIIEKQNESKILGLSSCRQNNMILK